MNDGELLDLEIKRARALFAQLDDANDLDEQAAASLRDEQILQRVLSRPSADINVAPLRQRRLPRRWIATAAGVAAATIGIAVAATLNPSTTAPASAETPAMLSFGTSSVQAVAAGKAPSAHDTLIEISERAATLPAVPQPAATQRVSSYAWFLNTQVDAEGESTQVLAPTFVVTELAADGSMHNEERRAPALDLQGRVIDPNTYPAGGASSVDDLPAGTLDPALPWTLPRTTPELEAALLAQVSGMECSTDGERAACLYSAVRELYDRWFVPADLSAAVWRVMASEPAVANLGTTTDRLGRSGDAIAVRVPASETGEVDVMVIDPASGQMLGWEQALTTTPNGKPTVQSFQAIASTEIRQASAKP